MGFLPGIVEKKLCGWLVKNGYDEAYGARPLRRLIQKEVENALARRVLGSDFAEGERIMVTVEEDRLAFERLAPVLEGSPVTEPVVTEVSQAA